MTDLASPKELYYTTEHDWIQKIDDHTCVIGITDYAQNQLGDIVYVQLPEASLTVDAGDFLLEIESTKSVSTIYSPLPGTVTAVNELLDASPDLLNSDPYGEGWICKVRVDQDVDIDSELAKFLDAESYEKTIN